MNWYKTAQIIPSNYKDIGHSGYDHTKTDEEVLDIILYNHDGQRLDFAETNSDDGHHNHNWPRNGRDAISGRIDIKSNKGSISIEYATIDKNSYEMVLDVIDQWPDISFYVYGHGYAGMDVNTWLRKNSGAMDIRSRRDILAQKK